jgi:hypothetical protein
MLSNRHSYTSKASNSSCTRHYFTASCLLYPDLDFLYSLQCVITHSIKIRERESERKRERRARDTTLPPPPHHFPPCVSTFASLDRCTNPSPQKHAQLHTRMIHKCRRQAGRQNTKELTADYVLEYFYASFSANSG